MKIVYVHGLLEEEGGRLGAGLEVAAGDQGHEVLPVRWRSGTLFDAIHSIGSRSLMDALSEPSSWRAVARVFLNVARSTSGTWNNALANSAAGTLKVVSALQTLQERAEDHAVVAYSLGCKVMLCALTMRKGCAFRSLTRVVLVGAAVPRGAIASVPQALRTTPPKVVNVHSQSDAVLRKLYGAVHGRGDAAGLLPVELDWVDNIESGVGHREYWKVAPNLIHLATGGAFGDLSPHGTRGSSGRFHN